MGMHAIAAGSSVPNANQIEKTVSETEAVFPIVRTNPSEVTTALRYTADFASVIPNSERGWHSRRDLDGRGSNDDWQDDMAKANWTEINVNFLQGAINLWKKRSLPASGNDPAETKFERISRKIEYRL